MAAFNIINVASIVDGTATLVPAPGPTALNTAPAAGHVFEVASVTCCNTTNTAANATLTMYDGTNTRSLVNTLSIPPYTTVVLVDKSQGLVLTDTANQSSGGTCSVLNATSGTSSSLTFVMIWKDLS